MKVGDKVRYSHYGEIKEGLVTRISNGGMLIWIGNRWLHRESVTKIN